MTFCEVTFCRGTRKITNRLTQRTYRYLSTDTYPIAGMRQTEYEEKLKELGLDTLEEQWQKADIHMTLKIVQC